VEERAAVHLNKAASDVQGLWWSEDTGGHPLAGLGGEGRAQAAVSSSGDESWWGDLLLLLCSAGSPPLAGHGGEGMRTGNPVFCRSGALRSPDAGMASYWSVIPPAISPVTIQAAGQPLHFLRSYLTPTTCSQSFISVKSWPLLPLALDSARSDWCWHGNYLQALMPNRRLSGSSAVCSLLTAPSGVIPDDGEDGCARVSSGGEGADLVGISREPSEVVCAYCRDQCVIFTFLKSLSVNCNPPPI
jgi:hypothetical protein